LISYIAVAWPLAGCCALASFIDEIPAEALRIGRAIQMRKCCTLALPRNVNVV